MTDHPAILLLSDMPPSSRTAPGKEGSRVSSGRLPKSAIPVTSELLALAREGNPDRVLTQYVWGARPGHRDELVLRDRASTGSGELDERLYCLMDYFDPTSAVDTEGAVVERYGFSAFGVREVMAPDWSPRAESWFAWEFGFHGQFLDAETGYYNYGFRYYVPWLGRWVSRDPMGELGGGNLYSAMHNNVLIKLDYLGLYNISFSPMEVDPGYGWGVPTNSTWIGWTTYEEDVSCTCEKPCAVSCKISITATIALNSNYFGSWRMNEVYGHEQAHIMSRNSSLKLIAAGYRTIPQESKGRGACTREAEDLERDILADVQKLLGANDHSTTSESPIEGTPQQPASGSKNMPPDLPFSLYSASRR